MATYTSEQLRDAVMTDLKVKDAYSALSSEDAVLAEQRIQQVLENLQSHGLLPFDIDGDVIPARYFLPLVHVVALELCLPYGVDPAAYAQFAGEGRKELYRLKAGPYYGAVAPADYF